MQIKITNRTAPGKSWDCYASGNDVGKLLDTYAACHQGHDVIVEFDRYKAFTGEVDSLRWCAWFAAGDHREG